MARFEKFDIIVKTSSSSHRIAKIEFSKDGSIYVFFPGFIHTTGILCRAVLNAGVNSPNNIDLKDNGKVTSHLVKYAHHSDGEAHFSQDGKIITEIRRKSVPLNQQQGHLFTIQIQNIDSFPCLKNPRKKQLTFEIAENIRSLKITGWRYNLSNFVSDEGFGFSSIKGIRTPNGILSQGLFVAPPENYPFNDVILFLEIKEMPWLTEDKDAQLIFLGGFDNLSIALNHSLNTEFLVFSYPCSDFITLKKIIGCIDL